jgi:putative ABC transport system permease protein
VSGPARYRIIPAKSLMSFPALRFFYRERLRQQAAEEIFGGLGIAVAVALVFAVTVASESVSSSASEVNRALVGRATLQLRSRGPEGFDESVLGRVENLSAVQQAAPLLEEPASIVTASGRHVAVNLAGTDISLGVIDGLVRTLPVAALESSGIGLSQATGEALGIARMPPQSRKPVMSLALRGHLTRLPVSSVLGRKQLGGLWQARIAVMPLERLQALAGLPGRLTRILVEVRPGQLQHVRAELTALAAGRLTVAPADQDVSLLEQALRPGEQSSLFFAAIAGVLGFLLAFSAFLVTVPERRHAIAELRAAGTRGSAIVQMVLYQGLCLGVAATALGLAVGYGLSLGVFAQTPTYLATGFTLGTSTVFAATPLLVAGLGGVLATCLACIVPLLDLRHDPAIDAGDVSGSEVGSPLGLRTALRLTATAAVVVVARTFANSAWPSLALAWTALLALAAVLCVPALFSGALRLAEAIAARLQGRSGVLALALESLHETTLRSLALVATGTVALFGAVALGGARGDLVRGIARFSTNYSEEANLWIVTPNDNQSVSTFTLHNREQAIRAVPGVQSLSALQGELLDVGNRRVWLLAWPSTSPLRFLDAQIIKGNTATAVARLHTAGWIVVSQQLAAEHHVTVGDTLALPTPTGSVAFRIAALSTNFGWTPGAIVMSAASYSRVWATTQPTALAVKIRPGVSLGEVHTSIRRALGPSSGLEVLTAQSRDGKINGSVSEGLAQLASISTLLILASILALAVALTSAISQRRTSLAALKVSGVTQARAWCVVMLESTLLLIVAAILGAAWGIYGQVALDGYLTGTTGFPVQRLGAGWRPLEVLVAVFIASLAISAIPTWFAARAPAMLALQNE